MSDAQRSSHRGQRRNKAAAPPAEVDIGDLDAFIGFHLRLAQDASFRAFARNAGQHGIKPGRFAALMVIDRNPGIGQGALGQTIARDKSTITPLVQELQRLGLIERRPSTDDRRCVNLYLTDAGKTHLSRLKHYASTHDRKLDEIVGDRKAEFLELLKRIANMLD
jgi:DNA-binding MarR family transcriptional regulator